MKITGRTPIIFLALTLVLLLSGTAITLYLLRQEVDIRRSTETSLEELQLKASQIETALQTAQKQIEVLDGKNKDADAKINSLMDELDLEAGLREQIKNENKKLKDSLEAEAKSKLELRERLSKEIEAVQEKLKGMEKESEGKRSEVAALQVRFEEVQKKNTDLEAQLKDMTDGTAARIVRNEILPIAGRTPEDKVNLDRIVVTPEGAKEGKVLNVDLDTEFLIFDIGAKNGIKPGDVMSVYRGKAYLGDIKVSRVQDEMAAADFIPPFSSRKVRKNDQVVSKR